MTYQTKISEEAKRDIRRMSGYILEYRAKIILKKMEIDIKKLKTMPRAHKTLYSSKDPQGEYRRMVSGRYIIVYQIIKNQINILRVFSEKQNYLNSSNFILKEESQNYVIIS